MHPKSAQKCVTIRLFKSTPNDSFASCAAAYYYYHCYYGAASRSSKIFCVIYNPENSTHNNFIFSINILLFFLHMEALKDNSLPSHEDFSFTDDVPLQLRSLPHS